MDIFNLQKRVKKITERYGLVNDPELCCLDLCSEVGEVAKEILNSTDYGRSPLKPRRELKEELGDAFYSLISVANNQGIDLQKALFATLEKYEKRYQR